MRVELPTGSVAPDGTERLAHSRADIARWLAEDSGATIGPNSSATSSRSTLRNDASAPSHLGALVLGVAAECLHNYPALMPARLAAATAQTLLVPAARTHPWVLVGVAAGAGAALVAAKPWRWLLRPVVLISVLSQVAAHALTRGETTRRRDPR